MHINFSSLGEARKSLEKGERSSVFLPLKETVPQGWNTGERACFEVADCICSLRCLEQLGGDWTCQLGSQEAELVIKTWRHVCRRIGKPRKSFPRENIDGQEESLLELPGKIFTC